MGRINVGAGFKPARLFYFVRAGLKPAPTILLIIVLLISTNLFSQTQTDFDLYMQKGQKSEKWDELVKAGFESFASNNYSTAMIFLEKAYSKGCRDGLLLYKLGTYHELMGNEKKGLDFLQKADERLKKQYPGSSYVNEMPKQLGELYFRLDKYKEAIPYLEQATSKAQEPSLLFILAQSYRKTGNIEQAKSYFEKALSISSDNSLNYPILLELMTLTYQLNDYEAALQYAEQILQISPNDPSALSYRNQIQLKKLSEEEKKLIKKITE